MVLGTEASISVWPVVTTRLMCLCGVVIVVWSLLFQRRVYAFSLLYFSGTLHVSF